MNLGARLKLVRGNTSQKAFAAELGVHENTVANAERRDSATQDYLVKIAEARNVNLNWLLTGKGAMFVDDASGASLLQEKLTLALADALRALYGSKYNSVPLETRARVMRAGANYLRTIGVTEEKIPDVEALVRFLKLTANVMDRRQ
jgi:transcriptional regulator with XRE-family HTH domain